MKEIDQHKDKIGQIIQRGDVVAFPQHRSLSIGIVIKINPKMIKIRQIKQKTRWDPPEYNKYPEDCVKLDCPEVSMYLIMVNS